MMERLNRWLDRHVGLMFAVLVILALFLLFGPMNLRGQGNQYNVPATLPGDVLYIDNTTQGAYLLWHAASDHFEIIAPYTQDQAFHMLLLREQAAWESLYWYQRGTVVKAPFVTIPGVPKR